MPHASFFSQIPRARSLLRPLAAILITCGLLTGFAAQVPSPPPPAPAAVPRPQIAPPLAAPSPAAAPALSQAAPATPHDAQAPSEPQSPTAQAAAPAPPAPPTPAAPEGTSRTAPSAETVQAVDATAIRSPMAVGEHLEYFLDESSALPPQDIITGALNFSRWQSPLPRTAGTLWLRLKLAPMPTGLPDQIYLHLGPGIPGKPSVWMTRPGSPIPVTVRPEETGVYPILYSQVGGALLIKLEAWPSIGFAPWVGRLDTDAEATVSVAHYAALALLGLAALLCLVRGLIERREWRIWAGLFALAALIQGIWEQPSLPGGRLNPWDIPAIVAPALALFILPHVGRNLMRPRNTVPWLDKLFIGVSLLGLCAGLTPLLPGQSWMLRWLSLWPLGIAATLFLTLPACHRGLAGCGRYLFACLLAVLGALPLLVKLAPTQPHYAPWYGFAPLCGLACAALLLSLVGGRPEPRAVVDRRAGSRRHPQQERSELDLQLDLPDPDEISETLPDEGLELSMFKKRDKRRDPNAFLIKPDAAVPTASNRAAGSAALAQDTSRRSETLRTHATPDTEMDTDALIRLEETLRVPLDALLRQAIALDMQPLPVAARQYVKELVAAGRTLTNIITNLSRTGLPQSARITVENALIDLPFLLRDAHAAVAAEAEDRNLAVSWYVAPHIGRRYAGPADRLSHLLKLLMESAVRATNSGSIQLWVRRVQESNDPGHIVFTVADTGSGMPPTRRNALLSARVWELAGEMDGTVHIDSGPAGTSISFSVILKALPAHATQLPDSVIAYPDALAADEEHLDLPSLRIILADDTSSRRQLLAYMLEDLPHEILEARNAAEAVSMHAEIPARLIVFDGNMPEKELIDAVASIRSLDGERDLPPASLLALVGHEAQGERLRRAGMNHILYKPISRPTVRQTVLHMAPVPGMDLPPLPHSPAPIPSAPALSNQTFPDQVFPDKALSHQTTSDQPASDALTPAEPAQPVYVSSEVLPLKQLEMPDTLAVSTPISPLTAEAGPSAPRHEGSVRSKSLGEDMPATARPPLPHAEGLPSKHSQPEHIENINDLPLPAHSPRTGQPQRKRGLLERLLGVLPRRRAALPDVRDVEHDADSPPKTFSRSVGEPQPIPRKAPPAETRTVSRTERPASAPPRLATPSDDSALSENGVGDPMPVSKMPEINASPASTVDQLDPHQVEGAEQSPTFAALSELAESAELPTPEDEHAPLAPHVAPDPTPPFAPVEDLPPLEPPVSRRRPSLLDLIQFVEPAPESSQEAPAPLLLTDVMDNGKPQEHAQETAEPSPPSAVQQAPEPAMAAQKTDDGDVIVLELLRTLDEALLQVQDALARKDAGSVMAATGQMAGHAERFGLHVLARLAKGMQDMAAEPDGLDAVADTMPDLRAAVERNRISFTAR